MHCVFLFFASLNLLDLFLGVQAISAHAHDVRDKYFKLCQMLEDAAGVRHRSGMC